VEAMPSSADRRRVEIPTYVFDRVKDIAEDEKRTVASVVNELLTFGVWDYKNLWSPADREKLGPRAARILELADQDEPARFDHHYVGTEHFLLAMLTERDGIAGQVLRELGVEHAAVSQHLLEIVGRGQEPSVGPRHYAPRVRKILTLALRNASERDHGIVGTGHLLLGLVREGEGIAAAILKRLGVDLTLVAERVNTALTRGDRPLADT
jgi:ATP-dependent Clp protease ATP-binding subunit ClpA